MVYDELKLLDVHKIAQEVLFGEQKLFEYHDRSSKHLARILSDYSSRVWNTPLKDLEGRMRQTVNEKLEAFRGYFQQLYTAEEVDDNLIDEFLDSIEIPRLAGKYLSLLEYPTDVQLMLWK